MNSSFQVAYAVLAATFVVCVNTEALEAALQKTLDSWTYPRYAFKYGVSDPHTGDKKEQWETRDGDKVKGSYWLVEPGGTIRLVRYHADDHSGFHADVQRLPPHSAPLITPLIAPISATIVHPAPKRGPAILSPLKVGPASLGPLNLGPAPLGALNVGPGLKVGPGSLNGWRPLVPLAGPAKLGPKARNFITISASQNGLKKWMAGPIPVIPGKVFVIKRKH